MGVSLERSILHVEGSDDQHSIIHLLSRYDISFDGNHRRVDVQVQGNDDRVLAAMDVAVKTSAGRSVGFVIDADRAIADRWRQVCSKLNPLGLETPPAPPEAGYVQDLSSLRVRVGVWLMPNNKQDFGKLENLLRTLVPTNDPLIRHAEESTNTAVTCGALFTTNDKIKAVLHSWLAWQRAPGLPFGTALKAKVFEAHSDVAQQFANWFKEVFRI